MYKIYRILNKCNTKQYIGLTARSVNKRFKEHCRDKRRLLSRAVRSDGIQNFVYEVLDQVASYKEALFKEKENIIKYNTIAPNGYNMLLNGAGVNFLMVKYSGQNELF